MSVLEIRQLVKEIRKKCGLTEEMKVPVCCLLEWLLEKLFLGYEWEIIPDNEMHEEGMTFTEAHKILIRESVYEGACNGEGRARFTVMHEIGHLILHGPNRVALCRLASGKN